MKVLYVKQNNQRLPKFQLSTKIIKINNKIVSIKSPLVSQANEHIEDMYENYKKLKKQNKMKLVETMKDKGSLSFEFIPQKSLQDVLQGYYDENNQEEVDKLINKYITFTDTLVDKKDVKLTVSKKFIEIFGHVDIQDTLDLISTPNIDLIFSNIFIVDDEFVVIDYEWVFDFEMPKDFIIARALVEFSNNCSIDIEKYLPSYRIYKDTFLSMENNFYNYVFGVNREYSLNYSIQKQNIDIFKTAKDTVEENTLLYKKVQKFREENEKLKEEYSVLYETAQSMRIKNRLKYLFKTLLKKDF